MKKNSDEFWCDFLKGNISDENGRYYNDFLNYDNETLEKEHDYIQYMFPIDTVSFHNLKAGKIDLKTAAVLSKDVTVIENLKCAIDVFVNFLYDTDWINKEHNFKRISRILKSLRIFGLYKQCDDVFSIILDITDITYYLNRQNNPDYSDKRFVNAKENYNKIGSNTIKHWCNSAKFVNKYL